jgi:hypothetical protein
MFALFSYVEHMLLKNQTYFDNRRPSSDGASYTRKLDGSRILVLLDTVSVPESESESESELLYNWRFTAN